MIQSPLKQGIKVKKWFGSNRELESLSDLLLCLSQGFGERPEYYGVGGHNGADFVCELGTPIYASHDGEAAAYEEKDVAGNFIGYGKYVTIRDRENKFKTEYCHLSEFKKTGQVKEGEVIGLAGSTGNSTAPHLHFTLKNPYAVDPLPHLVWFDMLTKEQALKLQALEGYSDPVGAEYWSGKSLDEYLKARFGDKIKELIKFNNE